MKMYSESIYKKSFSNGTMKEAYLDACKWLSTNVISKVELMENVTYRFTKLQGNVPTVTITLFVEINEDYVHEHHCKICKEVSTSFFISDNTNCDWCKIKSFNNRLERMLSEKVSIVKSKLNKQLEGK